MQPMVRRIAGVLRRMFASHIDLHDLIQAGNVGLVKAANSYCPSKGAFEVFAYFRVRGAIIDSQRRRTYRNEGNFSLQAIAVSHDGSLPPALDTDRSALPDELAVRRETSQRLASAIEALPDADRAILQAQMEGSSLTVTAKRVGRSPKWTRTKLAEARELVGRALRGE